MKGVKYPHGNITNKIRITLQNFIFGFIPYSRTLILFYPLFTAVIVPSEVKYLTQVSMRSVTDEIEEELAPLIEAQELKKVETYEEQVNRAKDGAKDLGWIHFLGNIMSIYMY